MVNVLQFGIPTLDELFGCATSDSPPGIFVAGRERPTVSICIEGADGTGKSVLAMHLAAYYAAQAAKFSERHPPNRAALYAATDLSFQQANAMWDNFGLEHPGSRFSDPFRPSSSTADIIDEVHFMPYDPLGQPNDAPSPITGANNTAIVHFHDLGADSAGDDWGMLNRLVASAESAEIPFLFVIDSVEGLETWVGEKDAFGEDRSRRSRVAQLLRTAKGKCHIVLIVEESEAGKRAPEEFISDVVIHVRLRSQRDYSRRTIEIEKARAQTHARGEHDFAIRSGHGSTTGRMKNPDDPEVIFQGQFQSYVYVFESLHRQSRQFMELTIDGE